MYCRYCYIFSSCNFGLEMANAQPSSNDYLNGTITTKIAAFYQNTKGLISGNKLIAVKQLLTPQSINPEDNLLNILKVCFITAYIMQFCCNFVMNPNIYTAIRYLNWI